MLMVRWCPFSFVIQLKPGEAIFTEARAPHAYIKGNIVECMAIPIML